MEAFFTAIENHISTTSVIALWALILIEQITSIRIKITDDRSPGFISRAINRAEGGRE